MCPGGMKVFKGGYGPNLNLVCREYADLHGGQNQSKSETCSEKNSWVSATVVKGPVVRKRHERRYEPGVICLQPLVGAGV